MVQLQESILKHLHHHIFSSMFYDGTFEAHCARILSCYGLGASTWLTPQLVFPFFQLSSLIFSTTCCMRLILPHPSIANILQCVYTHPINPMGTTFYVVFMATNALEPMMQFVTRLSPLHEMLTSIWDKTITCTSFNHIQLLSSTCQHCVYQRWHSHFS
jgi:hypothetical protein